MTSKITSRRLRPVFQALATATLTSSVLSTACTAETSDLEAELGVVQQEATQQNQNSTAIMLQGFHWNSQSYTNPNWYNRMKNIAGDIKNMGFTHVWFPPPTDSSSYEGYLPRQLNVLDSRYGSEADLKAAISAMSAQGIKSVADIVINHRVGTTNWGDFTNPTWGCNAAVLGDEWSGACGSYDSGEAYGAARDLDHSQGFVQNDIKNWLTGRIKAAGFSGLRFDYSKGYGANFAKIYHDHFNPDFCVGEVWTNLDLNNPNAHRQLLMDYINGTGNTCAAFDFTTKGLLNNALATNNYTKMKDSEGKPAGAIGWWGQKSVTFVDNHDTGPAESCNSGQRHWPVDCDKVMRAYAYVLTHPGIPTVYYPHVYDWNMKDPIKALMTVRKNKGIHSASGVTIHAAAAGLYAATIWGNSGQVAVKIGSSSWTPSGTGWTLATSGFEYAVWTK